MTDLLLFAIVGLQTLVLLLIFVLWRRQKSADVAPLKEAYDGLQKGQEHLESVVREELSVNRREADEQARAGRDETGASMEKLAESFLALQDENATLRETLGPQLNANLSGFAKVLGDQIENLGDVSQTDSDRLRAELVHQVIAATAQQGQRFDTFEQRLAALSERSASQLHSLDDAIMESLEALHSANDENWNAKRLTDGETARQMRLELQGALAQLTEAASHNRALGEAQRGQFDSLVARMNAIAAGADTRSGMRAEVLRGVVENWLQLLGGDNVPLNPRQLGALRQSGEKSPGTLDERLGQSLRTVSQRLESVHAELGEVQVLASGGDLNRVLVHVQESRKSGDSLRDLLEQTLASDQYGAAVAVVPDRENRADFAIRLPAQNDAPDTVWLPIDASFPQENYRRLMAAYEAGDKTEIEAAGAQLEAQIRAHAQEICRDFIGPPHTTGFAILFLPTEGLSAEVMRRADLAADLQREFGVTVAGPAAMAATLSALAMGFRTLAIQRRSSEIWNTLGQVKAEFGQYGEVLDAVQQKLHEASQQIDDTRAHGRAIERQLRAEATGENGDSRAPSPDADLLDDVKFDAAAQLERTLEA